MFDKNNPLLQDPKINYPIQDPGLSFRDYANKCREIIGKYRCDLKYNPFAEQVIHANSPYELQPEKNLGIGAVLLHGLFDSPFMLSDIAAHLHTHNILVRSHLLPGHGTVPGALLSINYQDWIDATRYAITNMQRDVERYFLVGYSTGATLLLYHSLLHEQKNLAGLILLAPAVGLYTRFGCLTGLPSLVGRLWSRASWLSIADDNDYAKYTSFAFNAAHQIYQLTRKLKEVSATHPCTTPMLTVISRDDKTVSSPATFEYFKKYATADSQMLIYARSPEKIGDPRIINRPATFPHWNIRDISHIAIPISPHNPHYGMKGDYPFSSHVLENKANGNKITYGSYDDFSLHPNERERLTFNPDFDYLKQSITQFIMSQLALRK